MNSGQTADCSVLVSYKYNILNFTFYSGMPLYHKKKRGRGSRNQNLKLFTFTARKRKEKKKSARICKLISLTATFPKAFKLVLQSLGASDECQF